MTRFQRKSCEKPWFFHLQSSSTNHLQSTWVYSTTWVSNLWENYKINPPGNLKSGWNNLVFSKIMTERSVIEKLFLSNMTTAGQFCFWMYISTAGHCQTVCKEWVEALLKCAQFPLATNGAKGQSDLINWSPCAMFKEVFFKRFKRQKEGEKSQAINCNGSH